MMGLDQMEAGKGGEVGGFWRVVCFFLVRVGRLAKQWVQGGVEKN